MFIFTNASPTLPSPTPPTLSPYLHRPLPYLFSLFRSPCKKMWDWRTDGWCSMQVRQLKVWFLCSIFVQIYKGGSLSDELTSTSSWWWPSTESLYQPSHPCTYKYWWSQMSWWSHVMVIGYTCAVIICSTHAIWVIEGSTCQRANWRPVLDLQVNGGWSQAYRDWWERWTVKACSISAPRGGMGLDTARTHWPLLDRFWTSLWCALGNLWLTDKLCLLEYKLMDITIFLYLQIWLLSSHWGQKKQKARIWIVLWAVHSSPVQRKESVFLCFLGWRCLSCLGISWDYKQEVAPTSYPCSTHPSMLPP